MGSRRASRRLAPRWLIALAALALAACSSEPQALEWGLRFASPADQARAVWAEAAIHTGSCTGPVVFSDEILIASGVGMATPARLGPGHYALTGRARDGSCAWFAAGCLELELPADGPAIVDLAAVSETPACAASECSAGVCTGATDAGTSDAGLVDGGTVDAGMVDAGTVDAGTVDASMPDGGALDGGRPVDGGHDAGPMPTDAGVDACVGSATDPLNCGVCGRVCGALATCASGACVCPMGLTWDTTRGGCLDVTRDARNCGSIGNTCATWEACAASACVCRPGLTRTGGGLCVDLQSSTSNCGAVGFRCGGASVCSRGACVVSCAIGLTDCGGACVNFDADSRNCGGCGRRCDTQDACVAGSCVGYQPALSCSSCAGCGACTGSSTCCTYGTSGAVCMGDTGGACP